MLKSIALTSLFATGSAFVAPAATASSSALRADVFGIEQEEALLNAKREGQDSWGAAVDVKENDVFGFVDEEKTRLAQLGKSQTFASADPFGYDSEPAQSLPVSYSTQELRAASVALPFAARPAGDSATFHAYAVFSPHLKEDCSLATLQYGLPICHTAPEDAAFALRRALDALG